MSKRILILMSDTGGGHRAVATAMRDALIIEHGDEAQVEILDGLREYTPAPMKYAPEIYPAWVARNKASWGYAHNITDTKVRARSIMRTTYITMARYFKRILEDHPADVIVSTHPVLVSPILDALMSYKERQPFITCVTDYASTHFFWYDPRADRILVPSKPALDRGLLADVPADKLKITGLPVNPSFAQQLLTRDEARTRLGWLQDKITVLLLGGGEGMGPLYEMAREINSHKLDIQLVVVAGKNKRLKSRLETAEWNQPTWIYPFTRDMPTLMSAADLLVTKAGAASITEGLVAGLPMIISDVIPGQETGNVEYLLKMGAGVYPGTPDGVGRTVKAWVGEGQQGLLRRAQASRAVAVPDSAFTAATEIWEWTKVGKIPTDRRNLRSRIEEIRSSLMP
ncbi:MAG: MGDG synthase family glycosyltransferase [Phototrophicaceae bacterium]|jgi:1,2-diacylglycerol 3-beta-galactosyltransferase